jgi:FdhD protein
MDIQTGLESGHGMDDMVRSFEVVRVRSGTRDTELDRAVTEEPLEIRLHRRPFAVVMRTPGADRELAAGFLLSERVIHSADDLGTIEHCRDTGARGSGGAARLVGAGAASVNQNGAPNIVNVTLCDASLVERAFAERRQVTTTAACGLCGRLTIESLATDVTPLERTWSISSRVLLSLPHLLRTAQSVFDATGGLHAAGLFTREGLVVQLAEDVGRHNAVDKVIGRMLMRDALPLNDCLLCVSGRTSFEIIQKALLAGIPLVAAVSAPSSLAIDLARELGVTLAGFVRGDGFNIYAHPDRVVT